MKTLVLGVVLLFAAVGSAQAAADLDRSFPADASIPFERLSAAVSADFIDPTSSQFKKMSRHIQDGRGEVICGWVNAKNSMGGYTPFYPFHVTIDNLKATVGEHYDDEMLAPMVLLSFEWTGCLKPLGIKKPAS
jgi:hypothetical protein